MNKHTPKEIRQVPVAELKPAEYNPRKWDKEAISQLTESITRFGMVDPIICNIAPGREQVVIGGHFRLKIAKDLGYTQVPVVYVNIPELERERELNLRLNRNLGDWDWELLSQFDESLLTDVGFTSQEIDEIFTLDPTPEQFDLQKELEKLDITKVTIQKGDVYQLGESRMMCGDSTIESDMLKLLGSERADMVMTDPPYILDYLHAKRHGDPTTGFGAKKNRRYLETDVLPDNFTDLWMANVAKIAKPNFSIIVYENWKNLRTIWGGMEAQGFKVRNMLVWHIPNRHQGFSAKYKFFSKHDIAMAGTQGEVNLNLVAEEELVQNEYETALFATQGKPNWEGYEKGKNQPSDFIEHIACDAKQTGQDIIFGTKPVEILIPYIKVLTKRGDLVVEPFGGSGSTLIASNMIGRRCYFMEKSPVYAEVIRHRWEKWSGQKAVKIEEGK